MAKFEVMFFAGDDPHLAEWNVVEWSFQADGNRLGYTVWRTRDLENGEVAAKEMARVYQEEYNLYFAEEFA